MQMYLSKSILSCYDLCLYMAERRSLHCLLLRMRLAETSEIQCIDNGINFLQNPFSICAISKLHCRVIVKHLAGGGKHFHIHGNSNTGSLKTNSSLDSDYTLNKRVKDRHEWKEMIELAKGCQIHKRNIYKLPSLSCLRQIVVLIKDDNNSASIIPTLWECRFLCHGVENRKCKYLEFSIAKPFRYYFYLSANDIKIVDYVIEHYKLLLFRGLSTPPLLVLHDNESSSADKCSCAVDRLRYVMSLPIPSW